ncbi:hypothetical protein A1O1_03563 [Capronia coronata CBS 617.96]|uniref:Methyltransferase domain-containing protein n=1 Tax=Capronia coronata CBS 617.96 TaxID=1182541 RepID=W9YMK8_9EURO|nr:uncharacterized protein A1O1_03563 [Capronia coronata CBS 617.96]EXJ90461.1 hypothetical protein A1O1_03563 [Capronia coronata CBS 617.96]
MSSSTPSDTFISETIKQYTPRAANYDAANGGWHAELAHDFVAWLPPPKGGAVLDLACGTGLVTLAQAEAVGPDGVVVGMDVTAAMLDEARRKTRPRDGGQVQWVLADITDLSGLAAIQEVVTHRGGFDVISCCSALVLLPDPGQNIQRWANYLKPGTGKIIIDVPTEDHTLQYLSTGPLRRAMGKPFIFDREWVRNVHSLEELYENAGLEVAKSFRTRSYVPQRWWEADEAMKAFEEQSRTTFEWVMEDDALLEKARQVWPTIWEQHLTQDGKLWDGHALYVSIGRRRQ